MSPTRTSSWTAMVEVVWSEIEKATSGIDGEWKANEAAAP